ncbi:hypothetical protein EFER_2393 [Escherichia fergusonii ATCC 35469]|uniref:Uncharacterized protein n=1 Tax=Escherichia fergusonii (strain ATCC 35469 / DSM 13698 / CCUG 18766 / IAM 14443 / JCM 21226 / LMG 7866 / NBRC 102419 / NCTC 12128 / CDC 0568-73) TaxID=585054 RepID=B7LKP7_ESCF3|nr:hypothetical protein EFER_2393 [Escherichia fergusonii ATCC 35469]
MDLTFIQQNCYKHHQKKHTMRKSYEVLITVEVSLCNGEKVLTDSFSKVISDSQVK